MNNRRREERERRDRHDGRDREDLPSRHGSGSCLAFLASLAFFVSPAGVSADAILPHGDPRLRDSDAERARQEEIRDSRLRQQGQGPNYRVEGELQGGKSGSTAGDPPGLTKQDTGLADPSVNPGQASGMKSVQGRIVKSEDKIHTIRQPSGADTTIVVDDRTRGDTDLRPGDLITGTVTPQGRAIVVQKESKPKGK